MARAALALGAAAAMSFGAIAGTLALHPATAVAAYGLAVVAVAVASLDRRGGPTAPAKEAPLRGTGQERAGLAALALACVLAVADRHLLVASAGPAPDDVLLVVTVIAIAAVAAAAPSSSRWRALAYGLALATYTVAAIALIAGKPYHTDAVVATHGGAELVLQGRHPYAEFDMLERLERFGLPRALATDLEDGSALRSLNYPVLAVLVPAPFIAAGLADVRALYLVELLALAAVAALSAAERWRAFVLAAVIGNVAILRQFVLAGVDPAWALFVLLAWLARERRWSAALLGLAVAARQPAWLLAPFVAAWWWRRAGAREATLRSALAGGLALAIHVPFLAGAPGAVIAGVTDVVLLPLERYGIGPSALAGTGVLPALPREAHLALTLAALAGAAWAYLRGAQGRAALTLPLLPLYISWRALQSYFAVLTVFLLVEEGRGRSARASLVLMRRPAGRRPRPR